MKIRDKHPNIFLLHKLSYIFFNICNTHLLEYELAIGAWLS